jgi:hypothetical protein
MTTLELKIMLPDALAQAAAAIGLLTPQAIERLLLVEVERQKRIRQLFDAADRLTAFALPPLSDDDVAAEIAAARAERRNPDAGRR